MISTIVVTIVITFILLIAYQMINPHKRERKKFKFKKCEADIDKLYKLKNDIVNCDDLITDIELCNKNRLKCFRIQWSDISGNNKQCEVWLGDNERQKTIFKVGVKCERDKLSSSLQRTIQKLGERSSITVTNTIEDTEGE